MQDTLRQEATKLAKHVAHASKAKNLASCIGNSCLYNKLLSPRNQVHIICCVIAQHGHYPL